MATDGEGSRIWIVVNRLDLESGDSILDSALKQALLEVDIYLILGHMANFASGTSMCDSQHAAIPLLLPDGRHGDEVQRLFRETLEITDKHLVLKLRNSRGSLIPINCHITPNSKFMPYTLEVVERYQNYKPMPRTVKLNAYNEMLLKRLQQIVRRLENLEKLEPELRTKREEKIQKEMEELNEKMRFLNKRMQDAESEKWQGMFKKHPLW